MDNDQRPRPTCVIVDDDPAVRRALHLLLQRHKLEPRQFDTARDVIEACEDEAPDIVFLDVALRGFDAIDVMRALASQSYRGAIQLMSGHHTLLDDVNRVGERSGLTMLPPLQKPFRTKQIDEIIEGYLN
jgi:FixJ family two-component response regulator